MQPWSGQYENQFEKEIYMAINVFRFNPTAWSVVINNVFNSTPELAKAKAMKKEILDKIKNYGRKIIWNSACHMNILYK